MDIMTICWALAFISIFSLGLILNLTLKVRRYLVRDVLINIEDRLLSLGTGAETFRNEHRLMIKNAVETLADKLSDNGRHQQQVLTNFQLQLHQLTQHNDQRIKDMHDTMMKTLHASKMELRSALEAMRRDNGEQLEKMRSTVDEKLHKTLENRLGQSFKMVNDSLEKVQKGLGEMKHLANGVGDLKKVLSNVKTRGILGEFQLGNILEQILSPDQYALNVATIPESNNHVEFAIRFPGKDPSARSVWLPIDSKFPLDKYEALVAAYDKGQTAAIHEATKQLLNTVRAMSKEIRSKYISPPFTTEFGILFLPVEGLYAEIVRHTGLVEEMQRNYKIMVAGPTNLAAFLNSLQMGFQSIAIEKRSSEVWKILGEVKTEFGRFGEVLNKTQKKLHEASNVIDRAGVRTRAIERKLRNVQELPESASTKTGTPTHHS